jgi:pimeloyl-ACP methyl ester carboxylesterase
MIRIESLPMLKPLLLSSLALALAACGGPAEKNVVPKTDANGDLRYGGLVFKPCALGGDRGESVEAQCATLQAPENHSAPNGRKISLAVAMIPAKSQTQSDPVVIIAGGPGQSILESYPMLHPALNDVRRNRNILLLDARGTGGSHRLPCDELTSLDENANDSDDPAKLRALTERCRDRLAKTSDLRFYATADHIRDLDLLRTTIGVEQLNLAGISYGTRVAQQYAARYPTHTRTVTLDSIAPNTLVLGQEHARNLDAAIKLQFARCAADTACKRNIGDPAALLAKVRTTLQAGGLAPVRYRDPTNGTWREEIPSFGHLGGLLRFYAYRPESASMLPLILHDASQGRYETLLSQSRALSGDVGDSIALGMHLSVSCTEDPEIAVNAEDEATIMGNSIAEFIQAQCAVWPKGKRDPDFRKPLSGDVPVLAISGEYDPVTPPRYGDEVVKTLPKGRHLVLPGQGHSVLTTGCMPKLFAQFVETADAKKLDSSCLKRLKPTPPFAGYYGWEP